MKAKYVMGIGIGLALGLSSCIEEAVPGSGIMTAEQVQASEAAQAALLPGIASCMTSCYYNGQYGNGGYPSQMYLRECYGEDFPVYDDYYSYFSYDEDGNSVTYRGYYIYRFYYDLIHNCNIVVGSVPVESATTEGLKNRGIALGFRAMAYMDLARYFEYQPTNYAVIDNKAVSMGCMGLTVSIVTEKTTTAELKNNPRVPFTTMYRFILTDLNEAERYLESYRRATTVYPDRSVIFGLKARLWLEMATRFERSPEDLAAQLALEGSNDGYEDLGVSTAMEAYQKAATYAQAAMSAYQPMTQDEYQDPVSGFNTAVDHSWMWIMRNSSTDEFADLYYYYSFLGQMVSEPTWAMASYGGLYRCITGRLYNQMDANDWRRYTWVSPSAAGASAVPAGYRSQLPDESWKNLPAYANLKFRSRSMTDNYEGRVADYPLMRMEEMVFIHAEATARLSGPAAGAALITDFVNTYRQTAPTYTCPGDDMETFLTAMMIQKRLEFWGEGIVMWDYKRLRLAINRAYTGTNYLARYRMNTFPGYVVPWMNICFPTEYESKTNPAAVGSPDPSQVVQPIE